ncbi:hypothetical protein G6F57_003856 [Rhizopus arrhizus]|nr:hypothetical protein G6F23_011266 [Rhizopus arrhizus]KAG1403607.1 hypothetical protein G6F58_010337 [Rhizopus delemar]KAG0766388.1 hypothetical protein G6F24_003650 [Rhizopus arrhizus]KAG0780241.1 hypothetical protein G6F22_010192 [Rhizopus arrhizus]KAG0793244.1 hypothetical protein G6F21_003766 [Rhizopus arrhizus]
MNTTDSQHSHKTIHHNITIHNIYVPPPSGLVLATATPTTIHNTMSSIPSHFETSMPTIETNGSKTLEQETNPFAFIGPLLGAVIGLGLVGFIVLYCFHQMSKSSMDHKRNLSGWKSTDSLEEGMPPPPVYTPLAIPTPVKEKRLTSDTLVDPSSWAMLKVQYSPQLALSPSLVSGVFKQDIKTPPPPPPLPLDSTISASNTLIDNSSWLLSSSIEKGSSQFDTYEPQLQQDDEDDNDSFKNMHSQHDKNQHDAANEKY